MTAIPKGLLALFSISWFSNGEYHPVFKVLKIIFISTHSNVIYPLKIAKPKISYKKKIMKLTNELDGGWKLLIPCLFTNLPLSFQKT